MKSERQLLDEIRLREASVDDARREHDAGELSDGDLATITHRENFALDGARRALSEIRIPQAASAASTKGAATRVRKRSRLLVALACFAVAAGVLVWANLGLRQAGSSATGGLKLSQSQKVQQLLIQGEADVAGGNDAAALMAYQQVLAIAPTNVAALTEEGWLAFSAGSSSHNANVVTHGLNLLRQALILAPSSAAPRLYYAIVAYQTPGNRVLAKKEFNVFVRQHPSKYQLAVAQPYLRALGLTP